MKNINSYLFTAISLVGTLPAAVTGGFLVVLLVVGLLVVGLLVVVLLDGFRVEVVLLVVGLLVVVEGASSSKALPEAGKELADSVDNGGMLNC